MKKKQGGSEQQVAHCRWAWRRNQRDRGLFEHEQQPRAPSVL